MLTATQSVPVFRIATFLAIVGLFGASPLEAKRKDDVVVMKDGDTFTGEIKKLENGLLYFKSGYMIDSVQLDWKRVAHVESKDRFNVLFADGKRLTGTIEELENQRFAVHAAGTEILATAPDVVSIYPVEETFLAQLTGSVDYGFNFTAGNNTLQSDFSGEVKYAADRWRTQLSVNSVVNHQSGASDSGRNDLDFLYFKSVSDNWFVGATANVLTSDQQDLTLRTTGGGGVGRDFLRSGTAGLFVLAGVGFSREQYSSSVGDQPHKSAEAEFQMQFFKSTFRKFQFNATLTAYPNLTTLGRVRLGAESNLKVEIIRNLFWKMSFYESYDSKPPVVAPKNDFGTSTSLGWTF